jgi:hypothetical protein
MAITAKEINLVQLDKELGSQGLISNFENNEQKIILCVESSSVTEAELEAAIAAHIAIDEKAEAAAAKAALLAKLGITADEAAILLA